MYKIKEIKKTNGIKCWIQQFDPIAFDTYNMLQGSRN